MQTKQRFACFIGNIIQIYIDFVQLNSKNGINVLWVEFDGRLYYWQIKMGNSLSKLMVLFGLTSNDYIAGNVSF